jgi:16S rRNA processing protein RimM
VGADRAVPPSPGTGRHRRLVVARVGRAHGVRGEVSVQVRTDVPQERFVPGTVLFAPSGPLTLRTVRDHNGVLLLGFREVADRTAAEALRGARLEAEIDAVAEAEDDSWFDHELVGLAVEDPHGAPLGRVSAVEHLPAQDLLEVERADGERRLVPLVSAIVPTVDVAGGRVVVDAPSGLLDDVDQD